MSSGALSGEELHDHWCPSTAYNCLLSRHRTLVPAYLHHYLGWFRKCYVGTGAQKVFKLCVDNSINRKSLKSITSTPHSSEFCPFWVPLHWEKNFMTIFTSCCELLEVVCIHFLQHPYKHTGGVGLWGVGQCLLRQCTKFGTATPS